MRRRCEGHLAMLVDPPRSDRHDVELFFVEHLVIVGIRFGRFRPLIRVEPPGLMLVGHRHNLALRNIGPHGIKPVPVIPLPRPPDDSDLQLVRHGVAPQCDQVL